MRNLCALFVFSGIGCLAVAVSLAAESEEDAIRVEAFAEAKETGTNSTSRWP